MGAIVQFDLAGFVAQYPEFAAVTLPVAQAWFNQAGLYHANDGSGPVLDATQQLTMLNMLTAHIGCLAGFLNPGGTPNPTVVGRISSVTQGSISVTTEVDRDTKPNSQAWFNQTIYGFAWWQAVLKYRSARYLPGFNRKIGGWGPGRFGGLGNVR